MFELDVKALAALGGCTADKSLAVYQYLDTLSQKDSYALLGGLQQRFGLRNSIASDPSAAVAEYVVSLQNELRLFESNVHGLLSLLSALNRFDEPVDPFELCSEVPQVTATTLSALKLCRCFADGGLIEQIQQVLITRADEAIEANDREILNLFLSMLGAASHELIQGSFAYTLATRILTHRFLGEAPESVSAHTVSLLRELAVAVLRKESSRVSELVSSIDASCGSKPPKVVRTQDSGWFDWWREQP